MYEVRSFSFANAQMIANERIRRLDELKSVIDQALDGKKFFENYMDLREEIIDSHSIEDRSAKAKSITKEEMKKHNKQAFFAMRNFLN
jgi:hypothetical protein